MTYCGSDVDCLNKINERFSRIERLMREQLERSGGTSDSSAAIAILIGIGVLLQLLTLCWQVTPLRRAIGRGLRSTAGILACLAGRMAAEDEPGPGENIPLSGGINGA